MAITINYAPAASQYGTAGFLAGRGAYDDVQRKRQQDLELALAEMRQRGELAGAQIAASRANTLDSLAANRIAQLTSIAANQQQQALDLVGRERSKLFDFYAGQADRFQTAQLNSALAQQKAIQDAQANQLKLNNDVAFEQFRNELEIQQERQKLAARLEFAQRQQEERNAAIDAEAQRRIDAIQRSEIIRPEDKARAISQIQDQAGANKAGGDWMTGSLGPSPQEQLRNAWNDKVLMVGQTPVQLNDDGTFEAVRGWQLPEEKAEQERELARAKLEFEKQQHAAKLKADAMKLALDMMTKTIKVPAGTDANGGQIMTDAPLFNSLEEAQRHAFAIYGLGQQAADEIQGNGFRPANQPTMEQLTGGGQQQESAPPQAGQPQASVPNQPVHPQQQTLPSAQERIQAGQPIASLDALQQVGQAPPDLTPGELSGIGASIVRPDQLPPEVAEPYTELGLVGGRLPDGKESTFSRRAIRVFQGALLAYGPDPSQWPPQVRAQIIAEAAEVQRLLRAQNGRSR